MEPREFFEKGLPAQLAADPAKAKAIGATYKFVVADAGTWVVNLAELSVSEGEGDAQCTVEVASADLAAILGKTLNPQMAFMSGKLKIKGDMGLAMKLGQVLG